MFTKEYGLSYIKKENKKFLKGLYIKDSLFTETFIWIKGKLVRLLS